MIRLWLPFISASIQLACLLVLVCRSSHLNAEELGVTRPDTIITDRPDFTESALAVPRDSLQIESGFSFYTDKHDAESSQGPEVLVRGGIADGFELRLGVPNWSYERDPSTTTDQESARGFSDGYMGFKYQIGPINDWDLALIPGVTVPVGATNFTSDSWDPELRLCISGGLTDSWGISGMSSIVDDSDGGSNSSEAQQTIAVNHSLSEKSGLFLEYAGAIQEGGGAESFLHGGFVYLITPLLQADIHGGFGLSDSAPDSLVAGGLSVRFD